MKKNKFVLSKSGSWPVKSGDKATSPSLCAQEVAWCIYIYRERGRL